jgi:hypothetical protein
MVMTEMDIETSVYKVQLTRLIAREDFINFIRRETPRLIRTKQTLIDTFLKEKNEALDYGLTINESKTSYLKFTR